MFAREEEGTHARDNQMQREADRETRVRGERAGIERQQRAQKVGRIEEEGVGIRRVGRAREDERIPEWELAARKRAVEKERAGRVVEPVIAQTHHVRQIRQR